MFAPFTVPQTGSDGKLERSTTPTVHWGNVDTGAQVNIAYSGVLTAFPDLAQYKQAFNTTVQGVGNRTTQVLCKLVNVPVSLGHDQVPGSCIRTTFYVLECPTYHFILGLTLLAKVDAAVFCSTREMQFRVGPSGKKKLHTIPLIPRSQMRATPAYKAVDPSTTPANVLETVPEGWEAGLLGAEEATYVGECLTDLLGLAALNNEGGLTDALHPLPCTAPLINPLGQFGDPAPPPTSEDAPAPSPPTHPPSTLTVETTSTGEPLPEQVAATHQLQGSFC